MCRLFPSSPEPTHMGHVLKAQLTGGKKILYQDSTTWNKVYLHWAGTKACILPDQDGTPCTIVNSCRCERKLWVQEGGSVKHYLFTYSHSIPSDLQVVRHDFKLGTRVGLLPRLLFTCCRQPRAQMTSSDQSCV